MKANKPEDYQDFRAECEKIMTEQAKQLNWPRREYIAPSSPDFGAMLFDEPEVVAVVARRFFGLPRPEFTVFGRGLPVGEPLVRLSDYEALQADRDQQYDMKVKAWEQRDAVTANLKALQTECDKLRKDAARYQSLLEAVLREIPHRKGSRGNAPGHAHSVPGIWDEDNGALAGKECAWCKVWNEAVSAMQEEDK